MSLKYEIKEYSTPKYVCMYFNEVSDEFDNMTEALEWMDQHDPEDGYPHVIVKTKEIHFYGGA